jgi:hypothetical protein
MLIMIIMMKENNPAFKELMVWGKRKIKGPL